MLLPFFRTSWGVGVINSAIFNSFHSGVEFGTILEGLRNFGGGVGPPNPLGTPLVCVCVCVCDYCGRKENSKVYVLCYFVQSITLYSSCN